MKRKEMLSWITEFSLWTFTSLFAHDTPTPHQYSRIYWSRRHHVLAFDLIPRGVKVKSFKVRGSVEFRRVVFVSFLSHLSPKFPPKCQIKKKRIKKEVKNGKRIEMHFYVYKCL